MKVTVTRCPKCGSTEAYCDESRSMVDLSYMVCPACGNGTHADSWEVSEDWLVDIELAEGEPRPARLPPLKDGEYFAQQLEKAREQRLAQEAAEDAAASVNEPPGTWRVMGHSKFTNKDYVVGDYPNERAAKRTLADHVEQHADTQAAHVRDRFWIVKLRWRLMGRDTFAREDYVVGEFDTEAEAKQELAVRAARHAATQDETLRDDLWIVEVQT